MSITDELRKWGYGFCGSSYEVVNAIADRIDAEHESACGEAYGNGVQSVALPDMTAYVKLPLDADDVPIRVGDVMEWVDIDGEVEVVCTVDAVGVGCFFAWDAANCRYAQKCANAYRHHRAPTVEDVLRQFAEKIIDSQIPNVHPTYDEAIAEYAAKLRLAGEAE